MRAINHALTGAITGLVVAEPSFALSLAFISHFAQDVVPHYDLPGDEQTRLRASQFVPQLIIDALLCLGLVLVIVLARPRQWVAGCICAFLATSPDLMWIRKMVQVCRRGEEPSDEYWWERFHAWVQWSTGPNLWWVEVFWFVVGGVVLWQLLI